MRTCNEDGGRGEEGGMGPMGERKEQQGRHDRTVTYRQCKKSNEQHGP